MMFPRLKLARNLLRDDGVIFISIDDHEVANLRKLCDEIFGESNFVAQVIWERAYAPINLMKHFSPSHDFLIIYAKDIEQLECHGVERSSEANDRYSNPDNDPRGVWKSDNLSVGPAIAEKVYPITTPSGRVVEPPAGRCWRLSKKAFLERLQDNRIWFGTDGNSVPSLKRFLNELRKTGVTPTTIWKYKEVGHSQDATKALSALFDGKKMFDYPKPVGLLLRCLQLYSDPDSIILDFFSGSGTTGQAVMEMNAQDDGQRKFILVQLPEECAEGSEAAKAGFKNIAVIGRERLKRSGENTREKNFLTSVNLDVGFRVLRVDSSSFVNTGATVTETSQENLAHNNILWDRSPEDLLFQMLLETRIPLSESIAKSELCGNEVFVVGCEGVEKPDAPLSLSPAENAESAEEDKKKKEKKQENPVNPVENSDGAKSLRSLRSLREINMVGAPLIACLSREAKITTEFCMELAKLKPALVFFLDEVFKDDSAKTNLSQAFDQFSPSTIVKVI